MLCARGILLIDYLGMGNRSNESARSRGNMTQRNVDKCFARKTCIRFAQSLLWRTPAEALCPFALVRATWSAVGP